MRIVKIFSLVFVISLMSLSLVGGCGGGGGDSTGSGFDNGGTVTPPSGPSTPPATGCQMPPLTTNFINTGYFFVDSFNSVAMGVTSDGNEVVMVFTDIPDSGVAIGAFGNVASQNICNIFAASIDQGAGFGGAFQASGQCVRSSNGAVFQVNDFVAGGVALGVNLTGECVETASLNTMNLKTMTESTLDVLSNHFEFKTHDEPEYLILDMYIDLLDLPE